MRVPPRLLLAATVLCLLIAMAQAARADDKFIRLQQASQAYSQQPDNAEAIRNYVDALQRAHLAQSALAIAHAHPGMFTAAQIRSLQADVAALLTREAIVEQTYAESGSSPLTDRTITMYETLIRDWQSLGTEAEGDLVRIRIDYLIALHASKRMEDVVKNYEDLLQQGHQVPDYALGDVADAYLETRQPEKAIALYYHLLNTDTGKQPGAFRTGALIGLFYALNDSGDIATANVLLDAAAQEQPIWVYLKGDPRRKPNHQKMDIDLTRIRGELYAGKLLQAQQQIDRMSELGPGDSQIRVLRAQIYNARGLHRHAEEELKIAELGTPRALGVEAAQADTAMALQEWGQARVLQDDMQARWPDELRVQQMQDEWSVHNSPIVNVSASGGHSSGSPVTGDRDWTIRSDFHSALIRDNWRIFAGAGYTYGNFNEGTGIDRFFHAGLEWRSRGLTAAVQGSEHRVADRIYHGLKAEAHVDVNDYWQLGGSAALMSDKTPLRALMHDVRSNRLQIYARWRRDSEHEWTLQLAPSYFTDGNRRIELLLSGKERLLTTPKFRLDALLELSASRNSERQAAYFNPRSDLLIAPALRLSHTLYSRYDVHWEQLFLLSAGSYTQHSYGTAGIFTLGYGQRLRLNKRLDTGFMLVANSRPYDGQRERSFNVFIDLSYRF